MASISSLRFEREGPAFEHLPDFPNLNAILGWQCMVGPRRPWWSPIKPKPRWTVHLNLTKQTYAVTRRGRWSPYPIPRKMAFAIYLAAMRP